MNITSRVDCWNINFNDTTGIFWHIDQQEHLSRDMTKLTKWLCAQRRLSSASASAQSDQSLRCPHEESLGP